MEQLLEGWMGIFWDVALLWLALRTARRAGQENRNVRLTALIFGAGLALAVIRCAVDRHYAAMILFALGFMLFYASFVLPEKRKTHEAL